MSVTFTVSNVRQTTVALLGFSFVFVSGCTGWGEQTERASAVPRTVQCPVGAAEHSVLRGRDGWFATVLAEYSGRTLFAEGIIEDPRNGRLFISGQQGILVVDPDWQIRAMPSFPDGRSVMGMALDERDNAIWAVATAAAPAERAPQNNSARSSIVKLARTDGSVLQEFALPGVDQWYGDIAVGRDEAVYVGNPRSGGLYILRPGANSVEVLLASDQLRGPQGMIATPDSRRLIIADYVSGMTSLDLNRRTVVRLESPAGVNLAGIDGIVLSGNDIFALQNGVSPFRILRLQMDDTLSRILAVSVVAEFSNIEQGSAIEPTLGALTSRGLLFVARSLADVPLDSQRTLIGSICRPRH